MRVLTPCLALLVLGACSTTEKVKDYAFTKAANTGNQYCQVRDEQMVKSFGDGVNRELREHGAAFELKAEIICDP